MNAPTKGSRSYCGHGQVISDRTVERCWRKLRRTSCYLTNPRRSRDKGKNLEIREVADAISKQLLTGLRSANPISEVGSDRVQPCTSAYSSACVAPTRRFVVGDLRIAGSDDIFANCRTRLLAAGQWSWPSTSSRCCRAAHSTVRKNRSGGLFKPSLILQKRWHLAICRIILPLTRPR